MNKLQEFLTKNDVSNITEVINLSGRLREFPITIKALPGSQYNEYQKLCIENPTSPKKRSFNSKRFNELLVTNSVVDPNFKDPEFQKANNILDGDATKLLYKVMLSGEISQLAEAIMRLSGFDKDMEEEVEEVKN